MPGWAKIANRLAGDFLELVFPRTCLVCSCVLDRAGGGCLCGECRSDAVAITTPACVRCGGPFFGELVGTRACPNCVELQPAFDQGKSLYLMRGTARELVINLKYRKALFVLEEMKSWVTRAPNIGDYLEGAVLVPVPLHRSRWRQRGFNQSQLLAELFAEASETAEVRELLVRKRRTATQTRLSRDQRGANVRGAFGTASTTPISEPERRHLLVDDVLTTGATLNAAARALKEGGVKHVGVLTFCHG